jgi:hypothetical protein
MVTSSHTSPLPSQVAEVCKTKDRRELTLLIQAAVRSKGDPFSDRLYALEQQLRLADVFTECRTAVQTLFANCPQKLDEYEKAELAIKELVNYQSQVERVLSKFESEFESWVDAVEEGRIGRLDAVISALASQERAPVVFEALCQETYRSTEWLMDRSGITKVAVEENLGNIMLELDDLAAEDIATDLDGLRAMSESIATGLETVLNELNMAVTGLLPSEKTTSRSTHGS